MSLEMIEVTALKPSKSNPRKAFDKAAIASLAKSIKTDGLLQNLVVLKKTVRKKDSYTIISGERRYRAIQSLIKAGDMPQDMSVPVEVKTGLSEAEALRVATMENIQQQDLSPLEEAEALKTLSHDGDTMEELCAQTGLSENTIRRRLSLLNLIPAVQTAMQKGAVSTAQAEVLSLANPEKQERLLQDIENGWHSSASDLKETLFDSKPSVARALFPLESYTGTITRDLFADEDTSYFDDEEQFMELQRQEAEKLVCKYEDHYDWAELVEGYFRSWEYTEAPEGEKGGAIVCFTPQGEVESYKGLIKPQVHDSVKEQKPKATYSAPLCRYMAMHKSMAVQADLLKNPRKAKEVMVCSMLEQGQYHDCLHYLRDDDTPSSAYEVVNTEVCKIIKLLGKEDTDTDWTDLAYGHTRGSVYDAVAILSDDDLDRVFTLLVTIQVGQNSVDKLDTSENSFFNRLASDLETDMRQHWIPDEAFLKRRNKDQLAEVIKDSGASGKFMSLFNYKKGEIIDRLEKHFAEARQSAKPNRDQKKALNWLPEAMQFPAINPDQDTVS